MDTLRWTIWSAAAGAVLAPFLFLIVGSQWATNFGRQKPDNSYVQADPYLHAGIGALVGGASGLGFCAARYKRRQTSTEAQG